MICLPGEGASPAQGETPEAPCPGPGLACATGSHAPGSPFPSAEWALPPPVLTLAAAGRQPRRLTSGAVFPSSFPHAHACPGLCSRARVAISLPARQQVPHPLKGAGGALLQGGGPGMAPSCIFPRPRTKLTLVFGARTSFCACQIRMPRLRLAQSEELVATAGLGPGCPGPEGLHTPGRPKLAWGPTASAKIPGRPQAGLK